MADQDFYTKPEEKVEEIQTEEVVPEKIKIGDDEFTLDEAKDLLSKGKFAKEIEEKQNIKLDKVWPGHQELSNKVRDYEKEIENLKQAKTATKVEEGVELSREEQIAQAKKEARELGITLDEDFDAKVDRKLEAIKIREDTQAVVETYVEKYGITTDEETLLNHMVETGIRNPEKAAKDLYEDKIDAWKEKQIASVKKPGMVTDDTSSAGTKEPKAEPVTKDNFFAKIDAILDREA